MLMLRQNPHDAYRKVQVNARILGSDHKDLVAICFEQVVSELGRAIRANEAGDSTSRSDGLTRAIAAITALEMGLDRSNPVAGALEHLYTAARETILDCVMVFNSEALGEVRADFAEIGAALAGSN
ncbi:flagellar protein FliS [Aurantiacibacter suaedae]|uniref:flagellar protein FliS n=1 Tax=Aurantiacibacter suaedae TaxID=2545755 RepID=UPI0010FA4055|nr:flagellar protein FliS [Aurantiacibacter suaedae]